MPVHKDIHLGTLDDAMPDLETQLSHPPTENDDARTMGDDDAPEGVTLERAAEIEAFLAVLTDEPRDALLGRFDIDEERWGNARKIWTERIEDEVVRAAAPGQRLSAEEKYRLSMRYSVAYARAAERAREDGEQFESAEMLPAAGNALGTDGALRLGSSHG